MGDGSHVVGRLRSASRAGVLRGMGQYTDEWFQRQGRRAHDHAWRAGPRAAYVGEGLFDPVPNLREHGNPEGTIPLAMARRKARTTCFAALHEPFDSRPSLVARRIDLQPAAAVRGPPHC